MLNFLYTIIIYPLKEIIEFVYVLGMRFTKNPGFSIIGVSIAVTLLCLPLYAIAEKLQEEERETQKKLKPKVDKIKKAFKGDEQYMILSTYYKQNHYHPVYALRSSISLLIQIPFFIAAYSFLSKLPTLQGVSFYFIKDLGVQDALIPLGKFHLNLLPVLMTLINCIAGAIYTKGFPVKEKLQLYGMALVFLVLLYTSPSGLVLYWTMNNVFSLVKNIFYKLKNPLKGFFIFCIVCLAAGNICVMGFLDIAFKAKAIILFLSLVIIACPFVYKYTKKYFKVLLQPVLDSKHEATVLFLLSCTGMALLTGLIVPGNAIASSVSDFCFIKDYTSPVPFIYNSFIQAVGLFIFWPCCFYFMYPKKTKTIIAVAMLSLFVCSLVNVFGFTKISSTMSNTFSFSYYFPSLRRILFNFIILLLSIALIFFVLKLRYKIFNYALSIICAGFIVVAVINNATISKEYKVVAEYQKENGLVSSIEPIFHISKDKQNVIVIMMDRQFSKVIPLIFEEKKELYDKFSGFTFYKNTISTGAYTNLASGGLWGGYEYSPYNCNKRKKTSILEKHNEALKVLPAIFSNAGYQVYVSDSPYANLKVIPDMTIFDDIPNVQTSVTDKKYTALWCRLNNYEIIDFTKEIILRDALWYGIFKCCPELLRFYVYENGNYWSSEFKQQDVSKDVIDAYAPLDFLPELTAIDSNENCCICFTNETTHDYINFKIPEYIPSNEVTLHYDNEYQKYKEYQTNAAALIKLAEFFDYLKENGVYDNTRIVIVSDHGTENNIDLDKDIFANDPMKQRLSATLFFKDFNSTGPLNYSDEFMCNADTPYFATKDIIENPTNPFTEKPILSKENKEHGIVVTDDPKYRNMQHGTYTYNIEDDEWFTVKDNMYDLSNWKAGTNE